MRNCLILMLGLAACSGDDGNEPNVPVATVTVTPSTSSIPVDGQVQLQAATLAASGGQGRRIAGLGSGGLRRIPAWLSGWQGNGTLGLQRAARGRLW